MTMFGSPWFANAGGYTVDNSCAFNDNDTAYLTWTPSDAPDSRRIFTFSYWMKRGILATTQQIHTESTGAAGGNVGYGIYITSANRLEIYQWGTTVGIPTTATFTDNAEWVHVVEVIDTTQATDSDRIKLYIDGTLITDYVSTTYPAQNADMGITSSGVVNRIGATSAGSYPIDMYLAEFHYLDGIAAAVSDFGQTIDSVYLPKQYSGSYGGHGYFLDFSDAYDLGKDASGSNTTLDHSGYTATAPEGGTANNAKDGDGSTIVTTSGTPADNDILVKYDCGSAQTVSDVKVSNYTQAHASGTSYRVEYSTDDSSWTTWDAAVNVSPGNAAFTKYISDTETSARYWRLVSNQNHDAAVSIGEFSLMSAAGNNFTSSGIASTDQLLDSPTKNYATFNLNKTQGVTTSEVTLKTNAPGYWSAIAATQTVSGSGKYYIECLVSNRYASYGAGGFIPDDTVSTAMGQHINYGSASDYSGGTYHGMGASFNSDPSGRAGYYASSGLHDKRFQIFEPDGTTLYTTVDLYVLYALDLDNERFWVGTAFTSDSSVTWWGPSGSGADPTDGGTTGLDISDWLTTHSDPDMQFVHAPNGPAACHANFGQSTYKFTPPTNYIGIYDEKVES